jgi:asparagine synthase (glutamine-hydrolysing)
MAMAHAVEGRYPFLDYRVVELAARMPTRYRLNGLTEKFILKKAAGEVVPRQIVERAKQPYRAPIGSCFFGERQPDYVAELLSERALRRTGCFDPSRVSGFIDKCRKQAGRLRGERENMALTGILSIQLLDQMFIQNFAGSDLGFHSDLNAEKRSAPFHCAMMS